MEALTYLAGWFGVLPLVATALVAAAVTLIPSLGLSLGMGTPMEDMAEPIQEEWDGDGHAYYIDEEERHAA